MQAYQALSRQVASLWRGLYPSRSRTACVMGLSLYITLRIVTACVYSTSIANWDGFPLWMRSSPDPFEIYFRHLLATALFLIILNLSLDKPAYMIGYSLVALISSVRCWGGMVSIEVPLTIKALAIGGWAIREPLLLICGCALWRRRLRDGLYVGIALAAQCGAVVAQLPAEHALRDMRSVNSTLIHPLPVRKRPPVMIRRVDREALKEILAHAPEVAPGRRQFKGNFLSRIPDLKDFPHEFQAMSINEYSVFPLAIKRNRVTLSPETSDEVIQRFSRQARYTQRGCDTTTFVARIVGCAPGDDEARKRAVRLPQDYVIMVLYAATPEHEIPDYRSWQDHYHCCIAVSQVTNEAVVWTMHP